jgi:arginase
MNIQVIGIPSNAGALYEGTEQAPQAIREAGLIPVLRELGFSIEDKGNLLTNISLPRHNNSQVRNWPAPRLVWENIYENASYVFQPSTFTILLGGDCSIEVGAFAAFKKVYGDKSHLLVIDGHVDTIQPKEGTCMGAAGMGLWILQDRDNKWSNFEPVSPDQISIIGPHQIPENDCGIQVLSYNQLTSPSYEEMVRNHLASIKGDSILVHLDVDVLQKTHMPAAYAPSEIGLDLEKALTIMNIILSDSRIKAIEITEYSADKDVNFESAKVIIELISQLQNPVRF